MRKSAASNTISKDIHLFLRYPCNHYLVQIAKYWKATLEVVVFFTKQNISSISHTLTHSSISLNKACLEAKELRITFQDSKYTFLFYFQFSSCFSNSASSTKGWSSDLSLKEIYFEDFISVQCLLKRYVLMVKH